MRLNLWLVFRPHLTQSELIKHMSFLLRYGPCKNLWVCGRHIYYSTGLFLVPRFASLTWIFCEWHYIIMWSQSRPSSASFYVRSFRESEYKSSGCLAILASSILFRFGHDSCTISPKMSYIIACSSTLHGDFLHWVFRGLFIVTPRMVG